MGIINVSLNGAEVKRLPVKNIYIFKSRLEHFNISVGELVTNMHVSANTHPQYDGHVSNINVFEYDPTLNLAQMSANLCNYNNGTYISWNKMELDLFGNAKLLELPSNKVCLWNKMETISLFLPINLTLIDANFTCHKLNGQITEYRYIIVK